MAFTHLHIHTHYISSLVMGSPLSIIRHASLYGMTSLALTDIGTMAGAIEFNNSMQSVNGPVVKAVLGCEFYITESDRTKYVSVVLLAKNRTGFMTLCLLSTVAQEKGRWEYISFSDLTRNKNGLICLLRIASVVKGKASEHLVKYKSLFGDDLYLKITRDGKNSIDDKSNRQDEVNDVLYQLSAIYGVKTVATNNVCFPDEGAEVLWSVQTKMRFWYLNAPAGRHAWLKNEEQMRGLFRDHPELIDNTEEVLGKIQAFKPFEGIDTKDRDENTDHFVEMVYYDAGTLFGELAPEVEIRT